MMKTYFLIFLTYDFEVEFISVFFSNNLDKFKFTTPLNKKITCMTPAIWPVECKIIPHLERCLKPCRGRTQGNGAQSGKRPLLRGKIIFAYPKYGAKIGQKLLQEAQQVDVDAMVNLCPGCHANLCGGRE
jgi:hypothetical protein